MRWFSRLKRRSFDNRPTLKVMNPRVGTAIIPLDWEDDQIFYQYLTNKVHSLHFEGSEQELSRILLNLKSKRGFTIQKMRTTQASTGKDKLMLLHLKLEDNHEIRRLIRVRA